MGMVISFARNYLTIFAEFCGNPLHAQSRQFTYYCFIGGKKFRLPLPVLIFDLVHVQYICFLTVQMSSFYPVTGLPVKRTAVTQTAHYPVTFGTGR